MAAQLFVIGFRGSRLQDNPHLREAIGRHAPGGFVLFDRDMVHNQPVHNIQSPEQVAELTWHLREASRHPVWIGVDQEGGVVNRLKADYGFPDTRSHKALGELDDPDQTREEGRRIAQVLLEGGFDLNFAPVVDLAIEPDGPAIARKERCFGRTAAQVTRHARAYIEGHREVGVLTCLKHFPGHGSARGDTHAGFVDVTDTWLDEELDPYRQLIADGLAPMVMTAHIVNRQLDPDRPSTLSAAILTRLLREELGFEGVLISDDMQMRAISDHYSLRDSIRLGLEAGLDVFCFGNNLLPEPVRLDDAVQAVLDLVREGVIPASRIESSAARILRLKAGADTNGA